MRKIHITLVLCLLAMTYACQKSDFTISEQSDEPTYNVRFNVQNFQVEYGNITANKLSNTGVSTQGALSSYINGIVYIVYDSTGKQVSYQIQQSRYDQNFGVITDKLKAGLYTFVIGAASRDTAIFEKTDALTGLRAVCNRGNSDEGGQDIFLYKKQIRIGKTDTSFNNIQPTRITGKLIINFKDSIPAEYIRMDVFLDSVPTYYNVATGTLVGFDLQKNMFSKPLSRGLVYHNLGSNNNLTITINGITQAYPEKIGNSLAITNVHIYPNKQTTLTGKFFDAQSIGIPITIDTSYSGEIKIDF